jgi:PIN domain nuclease of toxin-antitoxin system
VGGLALSARDGRPPYLLDTHIWLWYAKPDRRLHQRLRRCLDRAADELWLSPISVCELGLLVERGRIRLDDTLRSWVRRALERIPLHDAPLTREVALHSCELDLGHEDPADRFLAATALTHGLTLVTVDERLVAATWLPTISD